ncbi:hypothetical protein FRC04_010644 [Tulasnella sp. 424]|nr:hypothetical protein FRC04_010644 [Tulasnella sp. 424]KAG8972466.1 hypothetical protein FRC05_010059 [Tulasnella sp. 425]
MASALARPPFAVDDQDTQYVEHRRQPRRPREERNKISESTYNAYDNYLDPANPSNTHRDSEKLAPSNNTLHRPTPSTASDAHGAIGGGFFAALTDDDSDSDSDEQPSSSRRDPGPSPTMLKSKNQALFEAAVADNDDRSPSPRGPPPPAYDDSDQKRYPVEKGGIPAGNLIPPRDASPSLHPQRQGFPDRSSPSPTPSITPPPAAPVRVQIQPNAPQPTRPIPAAGNRAPAALTINPPHPSAFQQGSPVFPGSPMPGSASPYGTPGFHMTPTPIPAATSTPIQPVFIQPIKPAFIKADGENEKASSVMSHDSTMPILRGDKEDSLPLRSGRRIPKVGEKIGQNGDDFWRRFSMVVKAEKTTPVAQKKSEWLAKTQRGTRSHRRWAACIGIFLLAAIIGGAVTGWWFTRNNPDHQVPETLGNDTAGHTMGDSTTAVPTPVSAKKTTSAAAASKTNAATATDGTAKRIRRMVEEADTQTQHLARQASSDMKDVAGSSRRRRVHAKRSQNVARHVEPQAELSS